MFAHFKTEETFTYNQNKKQVIPIWLPACLLQKLIYWFIIFLSMKLSLNTWSHYLCFLKAIDQHSGERKSDQLVWSQELNVNTITHCNYNTCHSLLPFSSDTPYCEHSTKYWTWAAVTHVLYENVQSAKLRKHLVFTSWVLCGQTNPFFCTTHSWESQIIVLTKTLRTGREE